MTFNRRDFRIGAGIVLLGFILYGVVHGQERQPNTITGLNFNERFQVTMGVGAHHICMHYQQQTKSDPPEDPANFPDGMYKPSWCWSYDEMATRTTTDSVGWIVEGYSGPWKVWATIHYGKDVLQPSGWVERVTTSIVTTNVLEVVR